MYEGGCLNRDIVHHLSLQGHTDRFMVCDAGFAIPASVPTVDVSIAKDNPTINIVVAEILKHFSVEKIILSEETQKTSPTKYQEIRELFGNITPCETVTQESLRQLSSSVKFIIRTGDFTAYSNVLMVSGSGSRWFVEKPET
jgi:D-ribose pyranase